MVGEKTSIYQVMVLIFVLITTISTLFQVEYFGEGRGQI